MKKAILALAMLSTAAFASEKPNFSNVQLENLHYAYSFGEQFTKDGKYKTHENSHKAGLGYIMAAIAWQESSVGVNTGKDKKKHHAYGMFQNYLPTVRSRAEQLNWKLTDTEIKNLLKDRKQSARWAYIELSYWLNIHNGDMRKAISSYNAGWNTKAGNTYASLVIDKANYLKSNKLLKQVD